MNELTEHYEIPKPNPANDVADDVTVLQQAFDLIDALLFALAAVVAGKAATGHGHDMAAIAGLTEALASKMAADETFALEDLTDVDGAPEALNNYILTKLDGLYVFRSALSVLGDHGHTIDEVTGLEGALDAIDTALATMATAAAVTAALADKLDKTNGTATGLTVTGYKETVVDPAGASSFSPNLANGTIFNYDTTGNTTITLPTATVGQSFAVRITYGGAHTVAFAGATREYAGGSPPDPTSTNGAIDVYAFTCFEAGVWTVFDGGRDIS